MIRRLCAALLGASCLLAPFAAEAAPVTYLAADNINQTPVSPSNPLPTIASSPNFTPTTATCASTATVFAAARTGRASVTIENSGTTAIYVGGSGVTTSTGVLLPGVLGASITIQTSAAIYCIVATGTQAVTGYELY